MSIARAMQSGPTAPQLDHLFWRGIDGESLFNYSIECMNPNDKIEFKARLFAEFSRIGKALSSPYRLQLLDVLAQGERSVEELAGELGIPVANASQHLQVLRSAQLVSVRRDGLYARYSLAAPQVFRLWQVIRDLGRQRLAEVDRVVAQFLKHREGMEAIGAEELRRRLQDGDVVVLDVRPQSEYAAGHIVGALSVPINELDKRLREIPAGRDVVAYCRGPYCVFADEAVALLRERGRRALRLAEGFPDWNALGFPVEAGPAGRRGSKAD